MFYVPNILIMLFYKQNYSLPTLSLTNTYSGFRENRSYAATCTDNNDIMRDAMTCTCYIITPVCASTPNCTQRNLEDCCPDISIIEPLCPQSPLVNTEECCDLEVLLQCSASRSACSVCSEPCTTCPHEVQHQLNRTYELTSKTSCTQSKPCLLTKTYPTTVDLAKEWISNKTYELKHKIEDLISHQVKPCESKHVDFCDTCEIRCKHGLDPSPCQTTKCCDQPTTSCDRRSHNPNPCSTSKSVNYVDIAGKLCELCKHVLDPAPNQPVRPCRHVDVADKLCKHCKHILDSTPCQSGNSCRYCAVAEKFCKHCKYTLVSASPLPNRSFTYVDIAEKLCNLCKHVLDPVKSCKHVHIADKLCEDCKAILDSAPCNFGSSCNHCEITSKLCEQCKHALDSTSWESNKLCKFVDMADKLCDLCRLALDPVPCQYEDPCKHCDVTKKLCKGCKSILDSTPCHTDRSCRNLAIADKLCDHCQHIINTAPCQPVKPCKIIDIADKFCDLCKHVVDPVPCQPVKSCKHISDPCQIDNSCERCDISKKLCKTCKQIFNCQTDISCKNVNVANELCEHCKRIYDSAPCQPIKSCLKHVEDSVQSNPCKSGHASCKPDNSCKHCDITKKLCSECKYIFDSAPCSDRTCKNIDFANKLCEHCRHIYDTASCQSMKSWMKHDFSDKSCEKGPRITETDSCKPDNLCKHCDIRNKLCKECKHIFDSFPCANRTCKNLDFANKLCEHCRHIYDTAPCQSLKSWMKYDVTDNSSEKCSLINEPDSCKSDNLCKHCDIRKKLCKECKHIFDTAPCADRSCKNNDFARKLCKHCRHIYETAPCQSMKSWMKHDVADKPCEKCPLITEPDTCKSDNLCKHCDIRKKLCEECKRIFDSVPCADRTCKNLDFANKLCEHCRYIYETAPYHLQEFTTKDISVELYKYDLGSSPSESVKSCKFVDINNKPCERCKYIPDSVLCPALKTSQYIQVPEEGQLCKAFEELFFNDQAAGCSSAELWKCGKCACALESQSAATLTSLSPLIQQEARSTSFDIAKESVCKSRGSSPGSPGGSCASARARYYQNKLLATLQILQNKEETVRVQAESLAVAESRIAALNARHTDLRREIDRKEKEIQSLRNNLKESRKCRVETCDVSHMTDIQDMDDQKHKVTTLQNNLDIIEDLYRECFYESVKQENLIEMLRKSYLDVRLMDEQKSDRITKLHNVINTQKWSLDRCQDIATEVENLKIEISNFINSSNNDSGMWEESVSGLNEDLQDIAAQLLLLRDLLTGDCSCGLEQENMRLRKEKECLEGKISSLRAQMSTLEENMLKKDTLLDKQWQEQTEAKERELECIREQLFTTIESANEKAACCDTLTIQLAETRAMLDEKTTELCSTQKQCRVYENTIQLAKEELSKSEETTNENANLRKELCCVSRRVARVQRRAAELEAELARARGHCERIEAAYREKSSNALELERQLDEAHAQGAALCGEAGRVVRAARCWAARMRDMHREQEKQINQKECKLRFLQDEIHKRQLNICPRVWEQIEQDCSVRPSASDPTTSGACSKNTNRTENSCPTVTFCIGERRHDGTGSSGSEIAGYMSTPVPPRDAETPSCSANIPSCSANMSPCLMNVQPSFGNVPSCSVNIPPCSPKRTCKKKVSSCGLKRRYGWLGPFGASARDAHAQHPTRCDAACQAHGGACARCKRLLPDTTPDEYLAPVSPGEEMLSRMESLSAALADGYRRWSRRAPT